MLEAILREQSALLNLDLESMNDTSLSIPLLNAFRLRIGRPLEEGMVITVEPGVYFIAALLEPAFEVRKEFPLINSKYFHRTLNKQNFLILKN